MPDEASVTETVTTYLTQTAHPHLRRGNPKPKRLPNIAEDHLEIDDTEVGRAVAQEVIQRSFTPNRIKKLMNRLRKSALSGDMQAMKLCLEYAAGRPSIESSLTVKSQSRSVSSRLEAVKVSMAQDNELPEMPDSFASQSKPLFNTKPKELIDVKVTDAKGGSREDTTGGGVENVPALPASVHSGQV